MSNRKPTASNTARFVDLTAEEYHADRTAIGRSTLWTFHESTRQFEGERILGDAPGRKKTKPMDIGTLCHAGLLEPEKLASRYAVFPAEALDKRGGETTNAAEKFRAENEAAGRIVVKAAEFEIVEQVVAAVTWKLGNLGWLSLKARREQAIFWSEPTTGLPCKALLDWLIVGREAAFVLDFKTSASADPRAFRYACEDQGYWLQDAHYSEGAEAVVGKPAEFLFVVAEPKYPFRTSINRLSARDRISAAEARRGTLANLKTCLRTGDFSESWENTITELSLRPGCYAWNLR